MENRGSLRHTHVLEEVAYPLSAHISLTRTYDHTQLQGRIGTIAFLEERGSTEKEGLDYVTK